MVKLYCNVCGGLMGVHRMGDFRRKVCGSACKSTLRRYKHAIKAETALEVKTKPKASQAGDARVQTVTQNPPVPSETVCVEASEPFELGNPQNVQNMVETCAKG